MKNINPSNIQNPTGAKLLGLDSAGAPCVITTASITAQGNPYKSYATKALATSDLANIPADALIYVNADSTLSNNGFYAKTGGALVQSSYDRVAAVETNVLKNSVKVGSRNILTSFLASYPTGEVTLAAGGAASNDINIGYFKSLGLKLQLISGDITSITVYLRVKYNGLAVSNITSKTVTLAGGYSEFYFPESDFVTDPSKSVEYFSWLIYKSGATGACTYKLHECWISNNNYLDFGNGYNPEINNIRYSTMTPITVKIDGTGDFTTIQEAINYAKSLSPNINNQFDIQVFDDHYFNSSLELYKSNGTLNTLATPTEYVSSFFTSDYIHVRGIGARRIVKINELDEASGSFPYSLVSPAYVFGNSIVNNITLEVYEGRYALHQDSSYDTNKTTMYKKSDFIYRGPLGNQAVGMGSNSGLKVFYDECKFLSSGDVVFYCHENKSFIYETFLSFNSCQFISYSSNDLINKKILNLESLGSGIRRAIEMHGSDVKIINFKNNLYGNETSHDIRANEWDSQSLALTGGGNTPTLVMHEYLIKTLTFKTSAVNNSVTVIGGTAKELIYGRDYKLYNGTADGKGLAIGNIRITAVTGFYLGQRLGDCSSVNKTLVVNYNSTPITITFNIDYTAASDASIIAEINAALGGDIICSVGTELEDFINFPDCISAGHNSSASTIEKGAAVVKTGDAFSLAGAGVTPYGFAGKRANPGDEIYALDLNKCLFDIRLLDASETTDGYYKCDADGGLIKTAVATEGIAVCDGFLLSVYK